MGSSERRELRQKILDAARELFTQDEPLPLKLGQRVEVEIARH